MARLVIWGHNVGIANMRSVTAVSSPAESEPADPFICTAAHLQYDTIRKFSTLTGA